MNTKTLSLTHSQPEPRLRLTHGEREKREKRRNLVLF